MLPNNHVGYHKFRCLRIWNKCFTTFSIEIVGGEWNASVGEICVHLQITKCFCITNFYTKNKMHDCYNNNFHIYFMLSTSSLSLTLSSFFSSSSLSLHLCLVFTVYVLQYFSSSLYEYEYVPGKCIPLNFTQFLFHAAEHTIGGHYHWSWMLSINITICIFK